MISEKLKLDDVDIKIISLVQEDPNLTHTQIAEKIDRSQPTVGMRIKKLEKSGIPYTVRMKVPEDAIRQYATRRFKEGFDVLLLGHFHEPQRWREGEGEIQLLDAWFRTRQVEWFGREA